MDMFRHVGAAIRRVRELRGIEQTELARRTGLAKSQISKYETGRDLPKLENLGKIIGALEATPQSFFRVMALLDETEALDVPPAASLPESGVLPARVAETFRSLAALLVDLQDVVARDLLGLREQ
ncbi:MAG TPA: helix-turn-helix transcriptional regulator [Thermoanaerobaculia bacterium]